MDETPDYIKPQIPSNRKNTGWNSMSRIKKLLGLYSPGLEGLSALTVTDNFKLVLYFILSTRAADKQVLPELTRLQAAEFWPGCNELTNSFSLIRNQQGSKWWEIPLDSSTWFPILSPTGRAMRCGWVWVDPVCSLESFTRSIPKLSERSASWQFSTVFLSPLESIDVSGGDVYSSAGEDSKTWCGFLCTEMKYNMGTRIIVHATCGSPAW